MPQVSRADLEKVAGEEICGAPCSIKEGFSCDGHSHCGKLGEVLHQAVNALQAEGGDADQQVALIARLLPRPVATCIACQPCLCDDL